jgi:hypothetical protein
MPIEKMAEGLVAQHLKRRADELTVEERQAAWDEIERILNEVGP